MAACWSRLGADFFIYIFHFFGNAGFLGADFLAFHFFGNTDVIGADFFLSFRVVVHVKMPKISHACRNFHHVATS